jgi:hypothetical protein
MLSAMTTAVRPQTLVAPTPTAATLSAGWVAEYRSDVPIADRWAQGIAHRPHSLETQERVCRMAEQLARQGIGRQELFTRLEVADRSVASSVDPGAVAKAGSLAISSLVTLVGASTVICDDGGLPDLRAFGFDPIPFDGHDPAAYAWIMFELTMRARAEDDPRFGPCTCHPRWAPASIGVAVL